MAELPLAIVHLRHGAPVHLDRVAVEHEGRVALDGVAPDVLRQDRIVMPSAGVEQLEELHQRGLIARRRRRKRPYPLLRPSPPPRTTCATAWRSRRRKKAPRSSAGCGSGIRAVADRGPWAQ